MFSNRMRCTEVVIGLLTLSSFVAYQSDFPLPGQSRRPILRRLDACRYE